MLQEWWGCLPHPLLSHPPSRWYTHVLLGACPRTDANDRRARSLQDRTNIQRYALSLIIRVELCEFVVNERKVLQVRNKALSSSATIFRHIF